jgi:hypothetical protein
MFGAFCWRFLVDINKCTKLIHLLEIFFIMLNVVFKDIC